jgi:hypothetical protein
VSAGASGRPPAAAHHCPARPADLTVVMPGLDEEPVTVESARLAQALGRLADQRAALSRAAEANAHLEEQLHACRAEAHHFRAQNQSLLSELERLRHQNAVASARLEAITTAAVALQKQQAAKGKRAPLKVLPDLGEDLRPDPGAACTAAELMSCLRQFRTWSGNPSYRDMAAGAGQRSSASAMHAVLGGGDLPDRFAAIDAIVEGCGGSEEDRQRFATAWRRLALGPASGGGTARLLVLGDVRRPAGQDDPGGMPHARSEPA